jgi:hypothetical protein
VGGCRYTGAAWELVEPGRLEASAKAGYGIHDLVILKGKPSYREAERAGMTSRCGVAIAEKKGSEMVADTGHSASERSRERILEDSDDDVNRLRTSHLPKLSIQVGFFPRSQIEKI